MPFRFKILTLPCILIAIAGLSPLARGQSDPPPVLEIGARSGACTSALRLGLQSCIEPSVPQSPGPGPAKAGSSNDGMSLESRVDAYLANYGKPPRAAVRALLEPSDENIRAFLADQEGTLSMAAYVAARMTALKSAATPGTSQAMSRRFQLQAFGQARLRLFQKPGDRSTDSLMRAMAELSQAMPGLQVGVQIVGPVDAGQLKQEIGRIDPLLSLEVVSPEQVADLALPFLRFDDLTRGTSQDFAALGLSAAQLGQVLLASRKAGPDSDTAAAAGVSR